MNRRPLSITITGWLFVLTGCTGLAVASLRLFDPATLSAAPPGANHLADFAWASASGLLAAAGGAFALRGRGWARWALAVWMGGHILISVLHSTEQLAMHAAIFAPLCYLLFRRRASEYFRGSSIGAAVPDREPLRP